MRAAVREVNAQLMADKAWSLLRDGGHRWSAVRVHAVLTSCRHRCRVLFIRERYRNSLLQSMLQQLESEWTYQVNQAPRVRLYPTLAIAHEAGLDAYPISSPGHCQRRCPRLPAHYTHLWYSCMFVATGQLDGRHGGDDEERKRQVRSWRCCPEVPRFRRTLSGTRARTVRAVKSV